MSTLIDGRASPSVVSRVATKMCPGSRKASVASRDFFVPAISQLKHVYVEFAKKLFVVGVHWWDPSVYFKS